MKYGKMVAQVLATVLAALVPLLFAGSTIDSTEWVNVALLGVGAAAVFAAPNVPGARYTKTILSVLTAVGVVLASVIVGGITGPEWGQIIVAALGAVGVLQVKTPEASPLA